MSADDLDRFKRSDTSALRSLLGGRSRPHRKFTVEIVRDRGAEAMTFAVRSLSSKETMEAEAEAKKWLHGTGGWTREDTVYGLGESVLNLETMVQILARALVVPDAPERPFAVDAEEVRKAFDADEIIALHDEYATHLRERSPFRHIENDKQLAEVIDALGKGLVSTNNFPRYDNISLRVITLSLAERVVTLTTRKSSATSSASTSHDDSSTESSDTSSAPAGPVMTVDEEPTPS